MLKIKRININSILEYTLVYWLMILVGSNLIYILSAEMIFVITLVLSVFIFILRHELKVKKGYMIFCVIFFTLACITMNLTSGDLSMGTILGVFSKMILLYVAISAKDGRFVERFIRIAVFMAAISFILWIGYTILGRGFYSIFSPFLYKNSKSGIHGIFLIGFNLDQFRGYPRNAYIFGEPGKYQMILNAALYFLLFTKKVLVDVNVKIKYIIILSVTIITVQSTEGYFIMAILMVGYFFTNKKEQISQIRKSIIILLIALVTYSILFAGENNLIQTAFFDKVLTDSGSFDLTQGTASARTNGIEWYPQFVNQNFVRAMIGVGANSADYGAIMGGILGFLFDFGLINGIFVYMYLFWKSWCFRENIIGFILCVSITILHGVSQPDLFSTITASMLLVGYLGKTDLQKGEYDEKNIELSRTIGKY